MILLKEMALRLPIKGNIPGVSGRGYVIHSIKFGETQNGKPNILFAKITLDDLIPGSFIVEDGIDPDKLYKVIVQIDVEADNPRNDTAVVIEKVNVRWAEGKLRGQELELRNEVRYKDWLTEKYFDKGTFWNELMRYNIGPVEESKLTEGRSLMGLKGYYDQGNWLFKWEGGRVSLQGTPVEQITTLLQKGQVKDSATTPRSKRNKTYAELVQGILTGTDRLCWIWSSDLPVFREYARSIGGIF